MIELTHERPDDAAAIETLLDQTFGADRHAKISYCYRVGVEPIEDLRWVARRDHKLVGTLRFWPVVIGARRHGALLLGPIAVEPEEQRQGVGVRLMNLGLAAAHAAGHRIVLLVGPIDYYKRFGFEPSQPHGIVMPDEAPERLLVRALEAGALDGVTGPLARASGPVPAPTQALSDERPRRSVAR
jgi:predicted N-acetyltransferase YhbS